jgi:hypothetical protein
MFADDLRCDWVLVTLRVIDEAKQLVEALKGGAITKADCWKRVTFKASVPITVIKLIIEWTIEQNIKIL